MSRSHIGGNPDGTTPGASSMYLCVGVADTRLQHRKSPVADCGEVEGQRLFYWRRWLVGQRLRSRRGVWRPARNTARQRLRISLPSPLARRLKQ